jgi:hypothetical protein
VHGRGLGKCFQLHPSLCLSQLYTALLKHIHYRIVLFERTMPVIVGLVFESSNLLTRSPVLSCYMCALLFKEKQKQENNFDHSTRDCAKFIGSTIFILLWQLGTRFSVTHHYYYPFAKDEVLEHHTSKSCDDLLDKHEGLRRIRHKKTNTRSNNNAS